MNDTKKPYKEPTTEIEILNAQLRIARWAAKKIMEYDIKLAELEKLQSSKNFKAS